MCEEREYHKKNCCDCVGPQGPQGPQGVMGMQGPQGLQGVPGAQGVPGHDGIQGVQGLQGVPGKDCDSHHNPCKCCESYANVFATLPQTVDAFGSPNDMVLFQGNNAVSLGDFDLSGMGSTGEIKFLKSGVFYINFSAEAKVQPPIPIPVPSFSFGLWINGVIVPGSVISGYTQAPADDTTQITSEVQISVMAGDVLKLRNASANPVLMAPNTVGIVFPVSVASININCLKSM